MKTIQKENEILRVKDDVAEKKVANGWKYIPRSIWKEQVRDVKKQVAKDVAADTKKILNEGKKSKKKSNETHHN
jgi:hypothetical protein